MAKKRYTPEEVKDEETMDQSAPEVVEAPVEETGPVVAPVAAPAPSDEFINLYADERFEIQPGIPRRFIYRGDTLDLMKLRPSQFERITTNADAARIVRKK